MKQTETIQLISNIFIFLQREVRLIPRMVAASRRRPPARSRASWRRSFSSSLAFRWGPARPDFRETFTHQFVQGRKIAGENDRSFDKDISVFQHPLQFAHIPGPGIAQKLTHHLGIQTANGLLMFFVEAGQEMFHQQGNIFRPFTQRRQGDGDRAEAVKEVLPEASVPQGLDQIAVGGADNSGLHGDQSGAAHPFENPLLRAPAGA